MFTLLAVTLIISILLADKLPVNYNNKTTSVFNKEKKRDIKYLEHLNLKMNKLKYLQRLELINSEKELSKLLETAKVESENNTIKEKSIKNKLRENISKESSSSTLEESHIKTSDSSIKQDSLNNKERNQSEISQSQTPLQRTDGLNFNGKHYDIKEFSGLGHVPVDNYVYHWTNYSQHYHLLAERQSPIGSDVRNLNIGSKILVNNQTYTIYNVITGVTNDENAYNILSRSQPELTIQSCDSGDENSTLTIWYAS